MPTSSQALMVCTVDATKAFEALLDTGYTEGPETRRPLPEAEAWLRDVAIPWWRNVALRASDELLPIVCYRGYGEYPETLGPAARLLHPHTSDDDWQLKFNAAARRNPHRRAIDHWHRLAAEPAPRWPGNPAEIEADYQQLLATGGVKHAARPRAGLMRLLRYSGRRRRLAGWQAALTQRARQDGHTIYCSTWARRADLLDPHTGRTLHEIQEEGCLYRSRS